MGWDAQLDLLTFNTKFKTVDEWKRACGVECWTKRSVLKTTASTFDPLGLLSPIIMFPRTIIQELWALKLDWDQPIDENSAKKWEECLTNLLKVSSISFPRWIYDDNSGNLELHIFCDASEKAYATTVFSRVISRGGEILTNLVMAKSRVAPLKNESTSRLELVACVLGTRLLNAVNLAYNVSQDKIFYYTDSRNALCWIDTPSHKLKTYVYNRSAEIQRVSKNTQWGHVPTGINPADIATRYVATEDLKNNKLWFEGPPFLRELKYKFEHFIAKPGDLTKEGEIEIKTVSDTITVYFSDVQIDSWYLKIEKLDVGKHYNTLHKFRLMLITVFKGIEVWSKKKPGSNSLDLYKKANSFLYRLSQHASFFDEIKILEGNGVLPKGNLLAKYYPYIDQNGVLRSNSRLDELDYLPDETRRPVIL